MNTKRDGYKQNHIVFGQAVLCGKNKKKLYNAIAFWFKYEYVLPLSQFCNGKAEQTILLLNSFFNVGIYSE